MPRSVVILGGSGGGRLAYWLVRETWPDAAIAFIEENAASVDVGGIALPAITDWNLAPLREAAGDPQAFTEFIVASGYPKTKATFVTKAAAHGLRPAPPVVHPKATLFGGGIALGCAATVYPGAVIAVGASAGDFVHIAPNVVLGHDSTVEALASLNAGCNVAGNCRLCEGVLVGAGAVVREHTRIAPWVTIGAQACVVKDIVEEGITVAGVPARPIVRS